MKKYTHYFLSLLLLAVTSLAVACGSCHDRKWLAAGIRNDAGLLQTLQEHLRTSSSSVREKLAYQIDEIVGKKEKAEKKLVTWTKGTCKACSVEILFRK